MTSPILITKVGFATTKNLELPPASEQMRVGVIVLDWSAGGVYSFDQQYAQYEGTGFTPQGMEIDNTTGADPVVITMSNALGWQRTIAPYTRRLFMVPAVTNLQFTAACAAGAGTSRMYLYNFPVFPESETSGGGNDYVADNADAIAPIATPTFLATLSRMMGFDGVNWDRVRLAVDNADAVAVNAVAVLAAAARIQGFNGASYDRIRALTDNADAQAPVTLGALLALSRLEGFNGANFDRIRALADSADGQAPVGLGALLALSRLQSFDGTNWNRLRQANTFATKLVTALGSTAIYTPAAGLYYRMLGYTMELTENVSLAAAGLVTASLLDVAAATGIAHTWFAPAAALTTGQGTDPIHPLAMGAGYKSAAAATALNANLSVALATGALNVTVALAVGANA